MIMYNLLSSGSKESSLVCGGGGKGLNHWYLKIGNKHKVEVKINRTFFNR
jgi:hypothetical protein